MSSKGLRRSVFRSLFMRFGSGQLMSDVFVIFFLQLFGLSMALLELATHFFFHVNLQVDDLHLERQRIKSRIMAF